jgi:hypothetical protein
MTDEDRADQMVDYIMTQLRPLIDSLAKQVGESIEAWRGVDLVINGVGNIMGMMLDEGIGDKSQLIAVASILAAIANHPMFKAAEEHWNLP